MKLSSCTRVSQQIYHLGNFHLFVWAEICHDVCFTVQLQRNIVFWEKDISQMCIRLLKIVILSTIFYVIKGCIGKKWFTWNGNYVNYSETETCICTYKTPTTEFWMIRMALEDACFVYTPLVSRYLNQNLLLCLIFEDVCKNL